MGPKIKLKKPNEQESDQSDNSDSSIESEDEYSGNEVNKLTICIWKRYCFGLTHANLASVHLILFIFEGISSRFEL